MTEYTSGHWIARKRMVPNIYSNGPDDNVWDGTFIIWSGDVPLAEVSDCDGIGEVQAEANANLMAVAPQMLEALELISTYPTEVDPVDVAEKTIARLKGETG